MADELRPIVYHFRDSLAQEVIRVLQQEFNAEFRLDPIDYCRAEIPVDAFVIYSDLYQSNWVNGVDEANREHIRSEDDVERVVNILLVKCCRPLLKAGGFVPSRLPTPPIPRDVPRVDHNNVG